MSTQIQIASDLHIEFRNDEIPDPLKYITPISNILVLAGDIGSFYKINQLKGFLERVCQLFEIVIYVPGNHEYYMVQNYSPLSITKLINNMYDVEKEIQNLYVLNQTSIVIGDICITGCTLWSKPTVQIPKFIVRIHGMNNEIYEKKFENDLKYIKNMVKYCELNSLKLVVVTHYCPTFQIVPEYRKRDKYISLYVTELDDILDGQQISNWICGHIHINFDMISEKGTRIIGNQFGKPRDKITDYKRDLVIKV